MKNYDEFMGMEYGCLVSKRPCLPYLPYLWGEILFKIYMIYTLLYRYWHIEFGATARVRFAWLLIASLFIAHKHTHSLARPLPHSRWLRDSSTTRTIFTVCISVCASNPVQIHGIVRDFADAFWLWCDNTARTLYELWQCGYFKLIEIVLSTLHTVHNINQH